MKLIGAAPLLKGSLGHLLQAHQHAIWGAEQGGCWVDNEWIDDPDCIMLPQDAAFEYCKQNPEALPFVNQMLDVFEDYIERFPIPPAVLAVEHEIAGVLGTKPHPKTGEPNFDLYLESVYDEEAHTFSPDLDITPVTLDCEGHPDHGKPIRLTRRIDLTTRERRGAILWDHKHTSKVDPKRADDAYAMDGGFSAFRILGKQRWPDLAEVALQLICNRKPYRVERPIVPATPFKDKGFARMVWYYEHQIAQADMMFPNPWDWPMAMSETVCMSRYGLCPAAKRFYGEAAKNDSSG